MTRIFQHDEAAIQERCHAAGTLFTQKDYDECMTRQELARETDINVLMRRYAPHELPAREVFFGERDYNQDFHEAVMQSREGYMWYTAKVAADPLFARKFPTYAAFIETSPEMLEAFANEAAAAARAAAPADTPNAASDVPR